VCSSHHDSGLSSGRWVCVAPTMTQASALGGGCSSYCDSGPYLINEVEGHGSLADPHLLGLPVLVVLAPDAVHALLQLPRRLVLLPVLLTLPSARAHTHRLYSHEYL